MNDYSKLLRLVDQLYGSVLDESALQPTMEALADFAGGRSGARPGLPEAPVTEVPNAAGRRDHLLSLPAPVAVANHTALARSTWLLQPVFAYMDFSCALHVLTETASCSAASFSRTPPDSAQAKRASEGVSLRSRSTRSAAPK
jgi:hypothetical protein